MHISQINILIFNFDACYMFWIHFSTYYTTYTDERKM